MRDAGGASSWQQVPAYQLPANTKPNFFSVAEIQSLSRDSIASEVILASRLHCQLRSFRISAPAAILSINLRFISGLLLFLFIVISPDLPKIPRACLSSYQTSHPAPSTLNVPSNGANFSDPSSNFMRQRHGQFELAIYQPCFCLSAFCASHYFCSHNLHG